MNAQYISDEELARLNVSRESLIKIEAYVDLLLSWQNKINLIGPSTVETVWRRHVLDALQLLPLMHNNTGAVADLGSGAGIPGLILTLGGNLRADLYESNGKKVAFLREAIRQTKANVRVHQIRLETLEQHLPEGIPDYVTARALAPLEKLLLWAEPLLKRGAIGLFHKGQDVDSEVNKATKFWKMGAIIRHASMTDSDGTILEVKEITRV
jgi:16S rRNA (guanine527-N7)-methyltransferase